MELFGFRCGIHLIVNRRGRHRVSEAGDWMRASWRRRRQARFVVVVAMMAGVVSVAPQSATAGATRKSLGATPKLLIGQDFPDPDVIEDGGGYKIGRAHV